MENKNYIFQPTSYDVEALLPQMSKALEKRTELISREQYPGLWKQTDRLNVAHKKKSAVKAPSKLRSVLCLLVGVFLFVPGVMEPQELLSVLIVGAIAIVVGIFGLVENKMSRKNPFDKSARLLLAGKDSISAEDSVEVLFEEEQMTIPAENGGTEAVSYGDFECVMETKDALLVVFGERVVCLQKCDLKSEAIENFCGFLSSKVSNYYIIE